MKEINKETISFNIVKARILADITQTELMNRTGLSRTYISALENNRGAIPSIEVLCNIADALNVKVDKLLYENLSYFKKQSNNFELEKEINFLSDLELDILLLALRVYIENR